MVVAVTPLPFPPYTPAIHMPSFALQIIKSLLLNFLSLASRVVKTVPSASFFTIISAPIIASASKACKGCPVSCKMKLVISTILFIGLNPIDCSRFFNHCGDSFTSTPLILIPAYLGQASVFSTVTLIGRLVLSILNPLLKGVLTLASF